MEGVQGEGQEPEMAGKGGVNGEACRKSCLEAQSQHPKPITAVHRGHGEGRGPRSSWQNWGWGGGSGGGRPPGWVISRLH